MARPSGHSGTWLPSGLGSHTIGRVTFLMSVGAPVASVVWREAAQLTPNANKTDISEDSIRFKAYSPGTGRNATSYCEATDEIHRVHANDVAFANNGFA